MVKYNRPFKFRNNSCKGWTLFNSQLNGTLFGKSKIQFSMFSNNYDDINIPVLNTPKYDRSITLLDPALLTRVYYFEVIMLYK